MFENETCSFCELMIDVRDRFDYDASNASVGDEGASVFKCKAALVIEDSRKSEFGCKISYNPRKLNFCPECGRRMRKSELYW